MSVTLIRPSTTPEAAAAARAQLHAKMLAGGWSPDDIELVERALTSARLHDTYLLAGYSPDEIQLITSLY